MNTPTIVVKATRVTTFYVKEGEDSRLIVSVFRPDGKTITALQGAERDKTPFHMDIDDETGEYTTGITWKATMLTVADDRKALNLMLTKA